MKRKTIKLDVDGVLRNMEDPILKVYNYTFSKAYAVERIWHYDLRESFPIFKELGASTFDFFFKTHAKETLENAEPYPGAAEAVIELKKLGYEIIIVSYQPDADAKIATVKWLDKHRILYDKIIFTNWATKKDIHCDIVIDDNPSFLDEAFEESETICITHDYNRSVENKYTGHYNSLKEYAESLIKND